MNRSQFCDGAVDVFESLPSRRHSVSPTATCDSAWLNVGLGQSFEPDPSSQSTTTNAPSLIGRPNNDGSSRNDASDCFAACLPWQTSNAKT